MEKHGPSRVVQLADKDLSAALVRLGATLAVAAMVIFGAVALLSGDRQYYDSMLVAGLIATAAGIMLGLHRPSVAVFLVVAMGAIAALEKINGDAMSRPGATSALVVLGMLGVIAVSGSLILYTAVVSALIVGVQITWLWGHPAAEVVANTMAPLLSFVFGTVVLYRITIRGRRDSDRYEHLFTHTPVALWEEDYSGVVAWLEGLRRRGITDLESHLDDNPQLILEAASRIVVRDANPEAERIFGVDSKEELLGPLQLPPSPGAMAAVREQLLALWSGEDHVESEYVTPNARGEDIDLWLRWVLPRRNGKPDPSEVVVAVADVTRQREAARELQRSRDRFERLAQNAPDIISRLRMEPERRWEYISPAVTTLLGYAPEEFYEEPRLLRKIVHPDDRFMVARTLRDPLGRRNLIFRLISREGRVVWVDHRLVPIQAFDGTVEVLEGITRDVTDRIVKEKQLGDLLRAKDEFVASVSHELRTPLTAVVGLAAELRDRFEILEADEVNELTKIVAEQAQEVADLVEDLLVAARAESGKVAVAAQRIDLLAEAETVLGSMAELPKEVVVEGPAVFAQADPQRVRQVLRNLLTNAFRYGGPHVKVQLGNGSSEARITVSDDGDGVMGIPEERVFEPYARGLQEAGQPGSVGLGLSVSRQLAELMAGRLRYTRERGWTVFELTLPGG